MKRALVLLTAAIPALAIAKPPAWFQDGVGEVAFSGTVELPLYRGPQTDYLPTIFVDVPAEEEGELGIVLESELSLFGATRITTGAAAELGLKVKDGTAVIPELHIGDALVLYDVRAKVSTPSEFDGADSTDLWLGVNAIDEIAVAVLPSTGTIRIVPSSEAASLLSGVGTPIQASVESDDKFWHRGHKV